MIIVEKQKFNTSEGRFKIYGMLEKFLQRQIEVKIFVKGTGAQIYGFLESMEIKGHKSNMVFLYFKNGGEIFLDLNNIDSFSYYGPGSLAVILNGGDESMVFRPLGGDAK